MPRIPFAQRGDGPDEEDVLANNGGRQDIEPNGDGTPRGETLWSGPLDSFNGLVGPSCGGRGADLGEGSGGGRV
jgi:hypothetical protein